MGHLIRRRSCYGWRFRDHAGVERYMPGLGSRRLTERLGQNCELLRDFLIAGAELTEELVAWVQALDPERRARLIEWGMVPKRRLAAGAPVAEVVAEWRADMLARGVGAQHARESAERVLRVVTEAGIERIGDLDAVRVNAAVEALRLKSRTKLAAERNFRAARPWSVATAAHHVRAVKALGAWLARTGKAPADPLVMLQMRTVRETERVRVRAALTPEQVEALLEAARGRPGDDGRMHCGGEERALLYELVACETGFRLSTVRGLMVGSLERHGDPATVVVAGRAKGGKVVRLPLTDGYAARLLAWVGERGEHEPLFPGCPSPAWAPKMLRTDMELAGLAAEDGQGRRVDFHALRHTFLTNLGKAGVDIRSLQSLAGHADIRTTARYMGHRLVRDLATAKAAAGEAMSARSGARVCADLGKIRGVS